MFLEGILRILIKWRNSSGNVIATTQDISNIPSGLYTLYLYKGSDSSSWSWTLTQPNPISLELDLSSFYNGVYNISDYGASDGSIHTFVQGGLGTYSYLWSNSSNWDYIEELTAGNYDLTVTDEYGCTIDTSIVLIQPSALNISNITSPTHHGYNISCNGGADGVINLTVSGGVPPYNYNWVSLGLFTEDLDSLIAGTYTVIVNDVIAGGQDTTFIVLTQPTALTLGITSPILVNGFNTSCFTCNDGSATATVSGGVSPYNYLWNTGDNSSFIDSLKRGIDTVVVTDNNGCIVSQSIEITSDLNGWMINGNVGINPNLQFIGTKDSIDVILKSNNIERLTVKADGVIELKSPLKLSHNCTPSEYNVVYANADGTIDYVGCNELNGPDPCDPDPVYSWFINPCISGSNIYLKSDFLKVGIGTTVPQEKLHIVGYGRYSASSNTTTNYLNVGYNVNAKINSFGTALNINDESQQNVKMCSSGGIVTIGTVTPNGNYKLFVRDGIRTEAVKVDLASANNWADYVFEKNYKLIGLSELEKYIKNNKHLPGIPSASEAMKNGVDLLEMDSKLLAKIEELTLYLIEQQKEIELLKEKLK